MKKIMHALVTAVTVTLASLASLAAAQPAPVALTTGGFRDLPQKDAFANRVYPKYFAFRGEMQKSQHADYDTWAAAFNDCSGVIRKFVNEELIVNKDSAAWANRYAVEHPEKLMLLHLDGQARQVAGFPDVLQRYFPGHWVYLPGTMASGAVKAADTTIRVKNARAFTMRGYVNRDIEDRSEGSARFIPQNVLLVRVDKQGNRLWYESEYAKLAAIDYAANTITLKRGQFYTTPRDFADGELYLAPIAGGVWGKDVMWFYNMSSACPRDKDGRQAWEVYAGEITGWFAKGGVLQNLQGIAFDVNYFDVSDKQANWDTNNDGKPDGGWFAGRNRWIEGDWNFLARLRGNLGRDFIMTSDSEHFTDQQAVGIMDGMESEGFVEPSDTWRGFSRVVNTHQYWQGNNNTRHDFRYVVLKTNGPDAKRQQQLYRFAAAAACCLEAYLSDRQPRDYMPADFTAAGTLGRAQGELMRHAKTTRQLFPAGMETLKSKIDAPGCDVTLENGKIIIRPKETAPAAQATKTTRTAKSAKSAQDAPDAQKPALRFRIKNVTLPAGDVTMFVRARAVDPLEGFTKDYLVPRLFWMRPAKLPEYDADARLNEFHTRIYGMIGTHRAEEMSFFFRRLSAGAQDLEVEVQGAGAIEITSLEIHNAPDIIARRFDNAIVLVNPSLDPARVDIAALFGAEYKKAGVVDIPALGTAFVPVGEF